MLAQGSATGIMQPAISIPFSAEVAKSVDAVDSKSTVEIRAGSSPAFGTIQSFFKSTLVHKHSKLS